MILFFKLKNINISKFIKYKFLISYNEYFKNIFYIFKLIKNISSPILNNIKEEKKYYIIFFKKYYVLLKLKLKYLYYYQIIHFYYFYLNLQIKNYFHF